MRKIILHLSVALASSILLLTQLSAQPISEPLVNKIDNLFSYWNKANSPGCAIGIVRNDSLIYAKGYGMANLEYNVPISPETIFHMASISKQFTAYSIVLLARQGKLRLDDDIHKYLSWFPDLHQKITIRQLLNHTSGIRDQWQLLAIAGTRIDDVITQEQIVKVLSKQQALNFNPGEQYTYSNSGFTMLAEIVKSVSGQTIRRFTDSAIFKKLGMKDTHFHDDYTEIVKNRAYSYQRENIFRFSNSVLSYSNAGATSLFTNINDLSKWVMNFYTPLAGDPADLDQLVQNGKLNNGVTLPYALGIVTDKYKGWKQYSHGGADAGFRTYISIFPELKMGFIVFSNLGDVNVSEKTHKLIDLFIYDSTRKITPANLIIDSSKAFIPKEAWVNNAAGHYIAEDGVEFNFALRDHRLFWERDGKSDILYVGIKDSLFVASSPEIKFLFTKSSDKTVLVNEYWPDNNRLLERYNTDSLQDKQLGEYVGEYYSPELDCKYKIVAKNHALIMTNAKYDNTKISFSGSEHLFTGYWWMRHLKMIRDKQHKIKGFEVNDGRVMHLKFDRK